MTADGLVDEPLAVEQYAQVHVMNVYPCGIIVNPWASWLAASPDRKGYLPNRQPRFGILEVKCLCPRDILFTETGRPTDFEEDPRILHTSSNSIGSHWTGVISLCGV